MDTTDKKSRVVKHGLEFIPLPVGKTESDFEVPHGKPHRGQQNVFAKEEEVRTDGNMRGR
ncbi:MAG: hypothetical protein MUQ56_08085 [Thermoleophilia bacterium]|nr:hypothetical protein [Thermoleophilia bacterium]